MARKVLSVQPNNGVAQSALKDSLFMKGRHDDLLAFIRERWGQDPELSEALEQGYAERGFAGASKRLADAQAVRYGRPGAMASYALAHLYAHAREKDRVIEWLEKAYEAHDNNLPYLRAFDLDLVRDDPRFQDLVRRVGLPVGEKK